MQSLMRVVSLAYLIALTVFLLTADPARLVGLRGELPAFLLALLPAAHFLGFSVLAVLALVTRWPAPRWAIAVFMAVYAGMTEMAQSCLPPRAAEWGDWLQDLAGIAVGAVLCWIVALAAGALAASGRRSPNRAPLETSDEWEVVQNVISRPSARGQSWWS